MRPLVAFFVDRPLVVNVITVSVCVLGAVLSTLMTRALAPPMQINQLTVDAELPGATAVEMETTVTYRLEEALSGLPDIEKLTSTTVHSRTSLVLTAVPGTDLEKKLTEVRSRLDDVRHLLPEDLRLLRAQTASPSGNNKPVDFRLIGIDPQDKSHRDAVELLSDSLRRIPGVLGVETSLPNRNLYIRFSARKLTQTGVNIAQARQRILDFFKPHPVGALRVGDQSIGVELNEPFSSLESLTTLPLRVNRAGVGVALGDVASVSFGLPPERIRTTHNGKKLVELALISDLEADVIEISQSARKLIEQFGKHGMPQGATIRVGHDVSDIIAHELGTVKANGSWGVLLVLLILSVFLGWRLGLVTAIGLPFCYLGIVVVMYYFDVSINAISLVAMILVVGILVDDAIIVAEEYNQLRAKGSDAHEASIKAVLTVAKPVLGMMMTTSIAFVPLLFVKGDMGWLFRPIPIVIISALILSLFESFFLLPNHLRHFMPNSRATKEKVWLVRLTETYRRLLCYALRLRYLSLLAFAGMVVGAVLILLGPMRFDGDLNISPECHIYVELKRPAASLDDLQETVARVEEIVKELPEDLVDNYVTTLGAARTSSGRVEGWKYATVRITPAGDMVEQDVRRRKVAALTSKLLKNFSDPDFERVSVREDNSTMTRDVVSVYVSGGDRVSFHVIQDALRDLIRKIEGTHGIYWDETRFQHGFYFEINSKALGSYGLSKADVQRQMRNHFSNLHLYRQRLHGDEIEIFVEFDSLAPPSVEALSDLTVMTARQLAVPLSYLGQWKRADTLRRIDHEDLLRSFKLDVLFDPQTTDAEQVAQALEPELEPLREKFPGYHISVKPTEFEKRTKNYALKLMLICLGLIYVCLVFALGSLSAPIPVLVAIPFGLIGVVLAFYVHGLNLGVMAVVGLLGLAGVVVNDSLVMTATIADHRKQEGEEAPLLETIANGASRRFCAVILTSITTLAGVFPMAYGWSGETGWIRPMILAIGWGLVFATVLTLVLVPCLLLIIEDIKSLPRLISRGVRGPR